MIALIGISFATRIKKFVSKQTFKLSCQLINEFYRRVLSIEIVNLFYSEIESVTRLSAFTKNM